MRATIRITNRTHWRTPHLRAFVMGARSEVFGRERKPLRVEFVYSRRPGGVSGYAYVSGTRSHICIPREPFSKSLLARLLIHELSHNAGLRVERDMPKVDTRPVEWAEALPLEVRMPKPAPSAVAIIEAKLSKIEARSKALATRLKRTMFALRKLTRKERYYERKLIAAGGNKK